MQQKKKITLETTRIGKTLYNVDIIKRSAQELPVRRIPLQQVKEAVAGEHKYWLDRNGVMIGPSQLLKDWDAAQKNEAWKEHIATIKRSNLDDPIFITKEGIVFDGMHRLTKAFLDGKSSIKAIVFTSLPEEAILEDTKHQSTS